MPRLEGKSGPENEYNILPKFVDFLLAIGPAFGAHPGNTPLHLRRRSIVRNCDLRVSEDIGNALNSSSAVARLSPLPFISGVGAVGGRIKMAPSHFRVVELSEQRTDEVPIEYADEKHAKHAFVTLTREGISTRDVVKKLAHAFSIPLDTIGVAGLKDRYAVATQVFSLPRDLLPAKFRKADALEAIGAHCVDLGFKLEQAPTWHRSKLRRGYLYGNYFQIIVSDTDLEPKLAVTQSWQIAKALNRTGWANFFGPQRFGKSGPDQVLARSRKLLGDRMRGRRPFSKWLNTLLLNGLQSALFNECLTQRILEDKFQTLLVGDLVSSVSSIAKTRLIWPEGRLNGSNWNISFGSAVPNDDVVAFSAGESSFTGPMFGAEMLQPRGRAREMESHVWTKHMHDIRMDKIKRSVLSGGRRIGRLPLPSDFEIHENSEANGLTFRFSLPCGAYATSLLREFVGREIVERFPLEGEEDQVALAEETHTSRGEILTSPWMEEGTRGIFMTCSSKAKVKSAMKQLVRLVGDLDHNRSMYTISRTANPLILFLRCELASRSAPVKLAERLLDKALTSGTTPAPDIVHLFPLQASCPARIDVVLETLVPLLSPLNTASADVSFLVDIKQRGSNRVDRMQWIQAVVELVQRISPFARVDLTHADTAIRIEVMDRVACLSVLPGWHRLHRYNLRAAASASQLDER